MLVFFTCFWAFSACFLTNECFGLPVRCVSGCRCFDPLEIHCKNADLQHVFLPPAAEVTLYDSVLSVDSVLNVLDNPLLAFLDIKGDNCDVLTKLELQLRYFVERGGFLRAEGRCPAIVGKYNFYCLPSCQTPVVCYCKITISFFNASTFSFRRQKFA